MFQPSLPQLGIFVATLATGAPVLAQPWSTLEAALDAHPTLQALQQQALAQEHAAQAAHALPDPEVLLGIVNLPLADPAFDRFLPTHKAIGLRQQFPAGATRAARSTLALAGADQQRTILAARRATLRAELLVALHQREQLHTQRTHLEAQRALADELAAVLRGELERDQSATARLAGADRTRADLLRQQALLEGDSAMVQAQLIELLGFVPDTPAPDVPLHPAPLQAQDWHPVRVAIAQQSVADSGVTLAEAAWAPTIGAQVTYQQRESGSGAPGSTFVGDDWMSALVTVSLPLWSARSQRPALRAAQARQAAAEADQDTALRRAQATYATHLAQRDAALGSLAALQARETAVDATQAALRSSLRAGRTVQSALIEAQIDGHAVQRQRAVDRASLAAATARANSLVVMP